MTLNPASLPQHRTAPTGAVLHGTLPLMPVLRVLRVLGNVALAIVGPPVILALFCATWIAGCAAVGFGVYGVILLGQAIIGA